MEVVPQNVHGISGSSSHWRDDEPVSKEELVEFKKYSKEPSSWSAKKSHQSAADKNMVQDTQPNRAKGSHHCWRQYEDKSIVERKWHSSSQIAKVISKAYSRVAPASFGSAVVLVSTTYHAERKHAFNLATESLPYIERTGNPDAVNQTSWRESSCRTTTKWNKRWQW